MPTTIAVADSVPVSVLDPYSLEFLSNPFPLHEQLRDAGPVVWLERYGLYAMARHKEVHAALNDCRLFARAPASASAIIARRNRGAPRASF